MSASFKKVVEDFTCEHCGATIIGTGYTNHCPHCLWSKHVDENPGDRAHSCGGMMRPVGLEQKKGEWRIIHRCQLCGVEKVSSAVAADNRELLFGL